MSNDLAYSGGVDGRAPGNRDRGCKGPGGAESARRSQSKGQTTVPQEPASSGEDPATATPGTASTQDPFDAAASKVSKTGASGSPSDPAGKSNGKTEKATFGAGCFWHVESEFEWLPGVKSAVSGYAGGTVARPSYEEVHEGVTGHAEVVQVEYDPAVISYEQLLNVFWKGHDPTQLNRQGPDVGTQYRSVIFYHSPEQRKAALKSYHELTAARVFPGPIVTQLVPMKAFFRARITTRIITAARTDDPPRTNRGRGVCENRPPVEDGQVEGRLR